MYCKPSPVVGGDHEGARLAEGIYVHSEDDARHDATNACHRVKWESESATRPAG
jgi:hypothetical protein